MKVKVGDKVKILAGKDKGKEGTVLFTLKDKDRVVVQGINKVKKHMKPGRMNENGQILEVEHPIHVSNVKVIEGKKETKKTEKKETAKKEVKKTTKRSAKKEAGEK